eukprot:14201016-Ditylum_brightwellii.AAC.1
MATQKRAKCCAGELCKHKTSTFTRAISVLGAMMLCTLFVQQKMPKQIRAGDSSKRPSPKSSNNKA